MIRATKAKQTACGSCMFMKDVHACQTARFKNSFAITYYNDERIIT